MGALRAIVAGWVVTGLAGPVYAQAGPVRVEAVPMYSTVAPGDQLAIAVVLDHAEGYHTWPGQEVLPAEIARFALRTEIEVVGAGEWVGVVGPVQWPEPKPAAVPDPSGTGGTVSAPVYSGRAIAYVPVVVAAEASPGRARLELRVFYQACDELVCYAPEEVTVPVEVEVVARGSALPEPAQPELFAAFDARVWADLGGGDRGAARGGSRSGVAGPAGIATGVGRLRLPVDPGGSAALVVVTLVSMLGGLLLNLTPCVLPMIPLKVMALSRAAEHRSRALWLGMMMSLGVVGFWLAIGAAVAFVATFHGPSQLFGLWWFTLGVGLFIGAMAIGLIGAFTIRLPAAVYALNPRQDTATGSIMFGVLTAILGLPCFAPFMGGMTAFATQLSPAFTLTTFTAIGVGMALPYMVLSAWPALVSRVPRSGPAGELVKQVMGLLLLAASAYFVGSGLISLVAEAPYLGRVLHWWAAAVFASAAGLWLIFRAWRLTRSVGWRAVWVVVGAIPAAGAILAADAFTSVERRSWGQQQAALAEEGAPAVLEGRLWHRYTPALFARAREEGHVVVVDFTAEWCLNCKTLEALVLGTEAVERALSQPGVVTLKADLTSRKDPGWAMLYGLGERGIPLLAVFAPGQEEPTFKSNAYTAEQVIEAVSQARLAQLAEPAGGVSRSAGQR